MSTGKVSAEEMTDSSSRESPVQQPSLESEAGGQLGGGKTHQHPFLVGTITTREKECDCRQLL
jgi:hypothetical protein